MPVFKVLLKSGLADLDDLYGPLLKCVIPKSGFNHVADIEAEDIHNALALVQNGGPFIQNATGTWAKEPWVTLTSEGDRLKCLEFNDSLCSLSIGDILIDEDGNAWMVGPFLSFLAVNQDGTNYEV